MTQERKNEIGKTQITFDVVERVLRSVNEVCNKRCECGDCPFDDTIFDCNLLNYPAKWDLDDFYKKLHEFISRRG